MKRLLKRYLVEIYEVDNTIKVDKNELKEELSKAIKDEYVQIGKFRIKKSVLNKRLEQRKKEIEDYYTNSELKLDTQSNKQ